MTDVEIGRGKTGRRAYSLAEIGIVPARRTRDPEEVSIAWQIDAYRFDLPLMACPMDSVVSPATAIQIGRLGGLAVLDLEGLWTRYEDPEPLLAEVTELDEQAATRRLQAMYAEPISEDLIGRRIEEIARAGVTTAASLSPQRTARYAKAVVDAGVDIFVIRGTTVSAEHVSGRAEPLNLKQFIYELDVPVVVGGCATYTAALHLMRTGAAGVLVGFGGGSGHTTVKVLGVAVPMATAIADVAAARRDYLDESGGRYVHVIADGSMTAAATSPRRWPSARTRSWWAPRWPGRPKRRAGATTGAARPTTPNCPAAPGSTWARSARWSRSCTARRPSRTAR